MADTDLIRDVFGITLDPKRVEENLESFAEVLKEIEKLRALDLKDIHPAVVFRPNTDHLASSDDG